MKILLFKFQAVLFIPVLLILFSCGNDDDNNAPSPKTKTELLTQSAWVGAALTVDPALDVNGTQVANLWAQFGNCEKDDLYVYKADKTYSYEEGLTKCDDNNPQVYETGTWTFNSDETILIETASGTGTPFNSTISTLSETQLIITYTEEIEGLNYTFTATLGHP